MRAVTLAVRGLWWRRGASAVIALVAVVCVAVAAAGPAYAAAARDAVVQTTLREAPVDADGTGLSISRRVLARPPLVAGLRSDIRSAFRTLADGGQYRPAVLSIQAAVHVPGLDGTALVTSPLVFREDVCAHVVMVAGSCLSDAKAALGGLLVSESTAADHGWTVGVDPGYAEIGEKPTSPPLGVRGIYRPIDPTDAYWFAGTHGYFATSAATDAVFVSEGFWDAAAVASSLTIVTYADLAFVPAVVHDGDLTALSDRVRLAAAELRTSEASQQAGDVVTTGLPSVVYGAEKAAGAVAAPVASVVVQLLVLSFAVLFLLMVGSHESRGGEVALGKLRGLSSRGAVSHAVLEPLLLLTAAVPLGVGVATLVLHAAAPSVVGRDAVLTVGATSCIAAVAAGAAGVLAGLLAGVAVLRRPVLSQWQRTERRPRRLGWIVEVAVVALALGATSQLLDPDRARGDLAFLPSATPALFALAFALIGARVLPLVARAGFLPTRASRFVGTFVALRQLARRRGGLRAFGVVGVAVALVVFGWCSHVVFQANRESRAVVEVGAPRVLTLQPTASGTDVTAIVDRVDPGGHDAAAVYQGPYQLAPDDTLATGGAVFDAPTSDTVASMLVVDPDRFARVASWTAQDDGGRSVTETLAPLARATPPLVRVEGTTLRVTGTVASSSSEPTALSAALTDAVGRQVDVALGSVQGAPGALGAVGAPVAFDLTGDISRCAGGCLFRQFSVQGQPAVSTPLRIDMRIDGVAVTAADGTTRSATGDLAGSRWSSTDDGTTTLVTATDPSPSLRFRVSASLEDSAGTSDVGFAVVVAVPASIPGLVTTSQQSAITGADITLEPGAAAPFVVEPTPVDLLPRAGDAGVLVPRDWLAAVEPYGYDTFTPNQVWLSASAPADFADRLAAAGLPVASVETVGERSSFLARQGPALAVAALGFGAAAAAILAVAGAVATFVVAARRRLYELAALRALGMPPRRIWSSVVAEQAVTAVVAASTGLAAGLLGARVALEVLPEFGDTPSFPPLLVDLPVGGSVAAAVAVAMVVVVATGSLAVGLVRRADTSRLRDSQG